MDSTAGSTPRAAAREDDTLIVRHSLTTRITHWVGTLAFFVLVMSGLQIFNAAPYLDASVKSDPAHRVLMIGAEPAPDGQGNGFLELFGVRIATGHLLGYTDDGMGGLAARAFPGWITFPGFQDLSAGRRWHLFFGWFFVAAGIAYFISGVLRKDLGSIVLRPSDVPKLLPMQLYYLRLRKDPPPYGKYNPLQKMAYTLVLFVFSPLIVLSGFALSPGIDAIAHPLTWVFGGRQFARLWHFVFMLALVGFFFTHVILVLSTGFFNNMRSMISGRYRLGHHEGLGP